MKYKGSEEFQNDMKVFETFLKKLRAEFNQHLIGNTKTPPDFTVAQVRKLIRKYAVDKTLRGTQRFLYFNLVAKFNTMMEFYNRRLRDIENGRQTIYRIIRDEPDSAVRSAEIPGGQAVSADSDKGFVIADAGKQQIALKKMFEIWTECSKRVDSSSEMDFDKFQQIINRKTEQLIDQKKCKAIRYKMMIEDGKIKIQAKPVK